MNNNKENSNNQSSQDIVASMSVLEKKRHSLAHLLAAAVQQLYPDAQNATGPWTANGFYYDFAFTTPITETDLEKIQDTMRKIHREWKKIPTESFVKKDVSADEAKQIFAQNKYKLDIINDIVALGEPITVYVSGQNPSGEASPAVFTDLCRGGHVEHMKEIPEDSYELQRIAGAYYKGSEKNDSMTRIYGLAFEDKAALKEYKTKMEEAKKHDHRVLNEKHDYFMISEDVGKGLPLYLPNGAYIRKKLEDFMYKKELEHGYSYVYTPVLTHKKLYEQSGHLDHYHEDMYSPIDIEGEAYYLRPMNCPHHHQIFKHKPLSYRDLPLRLAEFGMVHRFERSGVLTGLIRARCFTQNDSHIYAAKKDLKTELLGVLNLFKEVYDDVFGIKNYWYRLSLPDFNNTEKFGDTENREMWDEATAAARAALVEFGGEFVEGGGEAAFYGPKIDVQIKNVNDKEDTIATVQVDFYSANRFGLEFTNDKGEKEKPVIIHRAIMGSFDRFFAFLIEQYAGIFPVWLSRTQVAILPVGEAHIAYANDIAATLRAKGLQISVDVSSENLGKKVRKAKQAQIPYFIVIGDKEVQEKTLTVEHRSEGKTDIATLDAFLVRIEKEISEFK